MTRALLALSAGLVALLALTGCGYNAGLRLPEGQRTYGIDFFRNEGKYRDLEVPWMDELAQAFQRTLPTALVRPSEADVLVRGRILEYRRRSGVRSPDNVLLETGVQISVEAQLVLPARPDVPGRAEERILRTVRASSDRGYRLSERAGEENARSATLRNLADRVVLDLLAPRDYEGQPR